MSQGRANYAMEFLRYAEVPRNILEQIKERAGK
jgi:translation elongation factor EF-G